MPKNTLSTSPRAIWQLTWPQMAMMFFFFCLGLSDVWTAGQISADVQAAFGIIAQCLMLLQVFVMAMSSGAMAAVSQSLGAGKERRARRYIGMTICFAIVLGLGIAVIAYVGRMVLFTILATPENVLPIALDYWSISLLTLPAGYIFAATGMVFRATRLVLPPLFVAMSMSGLNIIGNLGFGLGWFGFPAFGYQGIAWTTFVCTLFGAVCSCAILHRHGYLRIADIPTWRWIRRGAPYLIKVAVPAGAASLVWHSGYAVLFAVVASLPFNNVQALAGMTAGMRAEAILFLPGMAFSMSTSVIVGNCLGAGDAKRAKSVTLWLVACGSITMSCVAVALWPFIPHMSQMLAGASGAHEATMSYLRFNFFATPFSLCSMILGGAMTGAGATRYNLMVYGTTFWLIRLPLAFIIGHYIWKSADGVFLAMLISQIVQSTIMLFVFHRADWTRFAMYTPQNKH